MSLLFRKTWHTTVCLRSLKSPNWHCQIKIHVHWDIYRNLRSLNMPNWTSINHQSFPSPLIKTELLWSELTIMCWHLLLLGSIYWQTLCFCIWRLSPQIFGSDINCSCHSNTNLWSTLVQLRWNLCEASSRSIMCWHSAPAETNSFTHSALTRMKAESSEKGEGRIIFGSWHCCREKNWIAAAIPTPAFVLNISNK